MFRVYEGSNIGDKSNRSCGSSYVKACTRLVVAGTAPVGRPRKTWQRLLKVDSLGRLKEMEDHRTV